MEDKKGWSNMEKITRKEMIDMVTKIRMGEGSDEEVAKWIMQIEQSVPHPEVLSVITRNKEGLSVEQIVDKLLNYKPIVLP